MAAISVGLESWIANKDREVRSAHLEKWANIVPTFSLKLFLEEGICRLRQVQWHCAENMGCGKEGELFAFTPQASEQTGVQWLIHLTLLMLPFPKSFSAWLASLKHYHMDDTGSRTNAEILNWMPYAILLTSALYSLLSGKKNPLDIRPNSGFIGKLAEPGRDFLLQMLLASVQQDASIKNTVLIRSIAWRWRPRPAE